MDDYYKVAEDMYKRSHSSYIEYNKNKYAIINEVLSWKSGVAF